MSAFVVMCSCGTFTIEPSRQVDPSQFTARCEDCGDVAVVLGRQVTDA